MLVIVIICLVTLADPSFQIDGGINATFGQFPCIASLQRIGCYGSPITLHECSATIISPNYVLTAAHCVNKQDGQYPILKVVTGLLDIRGGDETYRQEAGIEKIIIHPDYKTTYEQFGYMAPNDIAIVKLNASLRFDNATNSVKLPRKDEELAEKEDVQFVGWGLQVCFEKTEARLQTIEYNVLSYNTCYNAVLDVFSGIEKLVLLDKNVSLCTGPINRGAKVNVDGDSGGPLLLNGTAYGIHSWIFVYYNQTPSFRIPGPSGIYVKLSKYISWIKENVDDFLE
ncbi:unnamed protein product [Phyllotreta striolata]|uniref:Peptidase S1 domain-containing protein n=1 Tax=Phyllotreta striolata TaxID=444603 RepID=A0A9N9XQ26_PHYSR|nr:unnamed protein product [Phyllotreta striolata]